MKVLMHIPASVALKNGSDEHGYRGVDVPAASLTAEQREELAKHDCYSRQSEMARVGADFHVAYSPYQPVAFTTEEAIKAIDAHIAERAANAAEKAEREANDRAKHEARVQDWLARPISDFMRPDWSPPRLRDFGPWDYQIPDDPRIAGRIAEANAEVERLKAEHAKAEAEKEARKAAGVAKLRSWADAHGSDLLKARIAEGFAWEGLAEAEYGESAFKRLGYPESDSPGDPTEKDCTTPTLPEIEALRVVRKRITDLDLPARAELTRFVYTPETDPDDYPDDDDTPETDPDDYPDDDEEPVRRNEIEVAVTAPNGEVRHYYVLPKDVV